MRIERYPRAGRPGFKAVVAAGLISAMVVGLGPGPLHAQEATAMDRLDKTALKKFFGDFGKVLSSPSRWGQKDLESLAEVLAAGGMFFLADDNIQESILAVRTAASEDLSAFFSNFGDGFVLSAALLGFYAAGERSGRPAWRRTALLSLESLGATALLVLGSKFVVGRARPRSHEGGRSFQPFSFGSTYYSMPSGHSAAAWAVATTIADQSESRTVDAIAYGLATLVAVSRVHDDKHWASDVFLGSALGYFTAKKICSINRPKPAISPNLLETARLSFGLAGPRKSITLSFNW